MSSNNKSFLFLGDLIETDLQIPVTLFDEFVLTRPSKHQQDYIRREIEKYTEVNFLKINKFEYHAVKGEKEGNYSFQLLEEKDFKYFIIEYANTSEWRQQNVLCLSSLDMTVLF